MILMILIVYIKYFLEFLIYTIKHTIPVQHIVFIYTIKIYSYVRMKHRDKVGTF